MAHISLENIISSFNTPVIIIFLHRCITLYWPGVIIFIFGMINLIKNRQIVLAAWSLLSCIGYFIIMGLTYGKYDNNVLLFHIESEWVCFSILAATPFVYSFLPGSRPSIVQWLVTGLFVIRLVYIFVTLPAFTTRNQLKEQILGQMRKKGITKLAIYNDPKLQSTCILDWATPYESLFMSQTEGDKPQLTFLFVNPDDKKLINQLSNTKGMMTAYGAMNGYDFDKRYFEIDTTSPYQIMTYDEFLK